MIPKNQIEPEAKMMTVEEAEAQIDAGLRRGEHVFDLHPIRAVTVEEISRRYSAGGWKVAYDILHGPNAYRVGLS
jgi:hypothetical protein